MSGLFSPPFSYLEEMDGRTNNNRFVFMYGLGIIFFRGMLFRFLEDEVCYGRVGHDGVLWAWRGNK